jgi:hypothetical protein
VKQNKKQTVKKRYKRKAIHRGNIRPTEISLIQYRITLQQTGDSQTTKFQNFQVNYAPKEYTVLNAIPNYGRNSTRWYILYETIHAVEKGQDNVFLISVFFKMHVIFCRKQYMQ